jgi:hypothetical protein
VRATLITAAGIRYSKCSCFKFFVIEAAHLLLLRECRSLLCSATAGGTRLMQCLLLW